MFDGSRLRGVLNDSVQRALAFNIPTVGLIPPVHSDGRPLMGPGALGPRVPVGQAMRVTMPVGRCA